MSEYDEIRQLLEAARDSTNWGGFASVVRSIAEPDDGVFPTDDEFRELVLAMISAQSDALLRLAKRIDELTPTV